MALPDIFVALLTADFRGDPRGLTLDHRGVIIHDMQRHLDVPDFSAQPDFLFDPQLIIAESERVAQKKAVFLIEKQCPKRAGWVNHQARVYDISHAVEKYLGVLPKSAPENFPLKFFLIGGVGVGEDAINQLRPVWLSGAAAATDEYEAYEQFERTPENQRFFEKSWRGGIVRVTAAIPGQLLHLRGWALQHHFYRVKRMPETYLH